MDHYELLGVSRDVTMDELRRAYRGLAREHHPDRRGENAAAATEMMVAINEAFAVLSDPVRRFDYNQSLERSESTSRSSTGTAEASSRERKASPASASTPTDDDPARRARREAKERAAAAAKARGYRDPNAGRMSFRSRRRRRG